MQCKDCKTLVCFECGNCKCSQMQWINWKKEKPKEKGYYWFALRDGGDQSYGAHTFQKYDYYDPDNPTYAMGGREFKHNDVIFLEIRAWMLPPKWPFEMKVSYGTR